MFLNPVCDADFFVGWLRHAFKVSSTYTYSFSAYSNGCLVSINRSHSCET